MSFDDEAHRKTLVAGREEAGGVIIYCYDIHLQDENETAFFDALRKKRFQESGFRCQAGL